MHAPSFRAVPEPTKALTHCLHCRAELGVGSVGSFCCRGCEAVHALLHDQGLDRYYALGGGTGHPAANLAESDRKWLETTAARLASSTGVARVTLDVQGVHCSACVWLFEELFRRKQGGCAIVVNPGIGCVDLTVTPEFPLDGFVSEVEAFGYRFGPALKKQKAGDSDLVWRMGVCIAIAMNTMLFGIAVYCGLESGPVHRLFHALDFGLSLISVTVGGTVFFRSAWQAVRRRVLHLDLPIALGILLAFASSTYTYVTRGGDRSYFDTLDIFIALMLVGRFLQERVLAKNRAFLLASDGVEGLFTRRVGREGHVSLVRCTEVSEGDELLVGHGDLVPVDAVLVSDAPSVFSLDWINGESAPRSFAPGDVVPAGAFSQDARAVAVRAKTDFDASTITALLATSSRREDDVARATPYWRRLTSLYVLVVLGVASLGAAAWFLATHDAARTLDVVAAVLIVTCPCAFGIATPLAYELAQAGLRRQGLFVRTPGFLDRAALVERIVFDKTGTLTTGSLALRDESVLDALELSARAILADLALRSSHPKSRAVATALGRRGATIDPSRVVREVAGKGLEAVVDGRVYRLGAPAWATAPAKVAALTKADVLFTRDGEVLAALETREQLREDAKREIGELTRAGYEAFILSGDSPEATRAIAAHCGVPDERAFGARTAEGKLAWLRTKGAAKTLFVGDGINDSLVAEEASCAGTPAIDRPFMAARCDFYFVTPGLLPIRAALLTSRRLQSVVRTNLTIAIAYNAVTVALALAGLMTPLLCAVLMPVSSLSTVLATTFRIRRSWKS
ncbi:Type cbb3 cytochrome oxidase biogenesis protein CcoI [Labilithrix luteola]|uniref:Type cbb3 cytochrome oxidase biogenesis protein CcoI n=2 Tax=Labilithrix luteola TaxID=1391654 RepID=A0A0K1Q543_9BACT|nr:Type cbb3 cytochrome oxidase biogenesis protein CcoI [Labilithrix luteola]